MKNKMLLGVGALLTLSSLTFANNLPAEATVTVNIQIVTPITLTLGAGVDDSGVIDFGNVPQSTTTAVDALNTVTMNVTGAVNGTEIAFYIDEVEKMDYETVNIALTDSGDGDDITAGLSLSNKTDTVSAGVASSTISASIAAGGITTTNSAGNYSGTVQVFAEYN